MQPYTLFSKNDFILFFSGIAKAVVAEPVELVGNPLVLGVWVTCGQSVGNTVFVVNALPTGYPCPGRVIHKSTGLNESRLAGKSFMLSCFCSPI